jgi:alpha-L-rhamnosidase
MKKQITTLLILCFTITLFSQVTLRELTCEHLKNPIGFDVKKPRFSWKLLSTERNIMQSAYQIRVGTATVFDKKTIIWESVKTTTDESILQEYKGPELKSTTRYYWQVKIWDQKNRESSWSEIAFFETAFLNTADWKAKWIDPEKEIDKNKSQPSPMLRKEFAVANKVASARLYATSFGLNEFYLNGQRVSDYYFTPGWTNYDKRLQYFTFDVTNQVKNGPNALSATLGDGWYRGFLGWATRRNTYGERLALLAQLVITFTDGTQQIIATDDTWKAHNNGPIRMSDIYNGETYDARMEIKGWTNAGFDDKTWWKTSIVNHPLSILTATTVLPVKKQEEIRAIKIIKTPKGETVVDFGQNMTGWVKLKIRGKAGDKITINHAEVLDKFGNFYTGNMRQAKTEINYILRGGDEETYEPHFTFMGFRYVKVTGFEPNLESLTGIVIHSEMAQTGDFTCSDKLLNQLQSNIKWGQKGNFLDVPTDCPQRDERMGWTGDAQAFARTAAYNRNVAAFFTKWLADVSAEQKPDGSIPFVVPDVITKSTPETFSSLAKYPTSAGWADVVTIAPWTMYQAYGDRRLLENQYPSMKTYLDHISKKAGDAYLWKGGSVFGDWLFYKAAPHQQEGDGHTPNDYIATAFYAYSSKLVAQAATVLGKKEDAIFYNNLFEKVKTAFQNEYLTKSGRLAPESQTAYVLALNFDLIPKELKIKASAHLAQDVKDHWNHLTTGFLGTPYLCQVLSDNGYTQTGYDLLMQQGYPSWLYPVKMGATTIWERWDGIKPDSTFQDEGMNSFNHYAYGAIGDWMYRVVAGIELGKPAYKHILIQPHPNDTVKTLTFVKATLNSPHGMIESGWEKTTKGMKITVKVPANTTATIVLPTSDVDNLTESGQKWTGKPPLSLPAGQAGMDGKISLEVGSGDYVFEYEIKR